MLTHVARDGITVRATKAGRKHRPNGRSTFTDRVCAASSTARSSRRLASSIAVSILIRGEAPCLHDGSRTFLIRAHIWLSISFKGIADVSHASSHGWPLHRLEETAAKHRPQPSPITDPTASSARGIEDPCCIATANISRISWTGKTGAAKGPDTPIRSYRAHSADPAGPPDSVFHKLRRVSHRQIQPCCYLLPDAAAGCVLPLLPPSCLCCRAGQLHRIPYSLRIPIWPGPRKNTSCQIFHTFFLEMADQRFYPYSSDPIKNTCAGQA